MVREDTATSVVDDVAVSVGGGTEGTREADMSDDGTAIAATPVDGGVPVALFAVILDEGASTIGEPSRCCGCDCIVPGAATAMDEDADDAEEESTTFPVSFCSCC